MTDANWLAQQFEGNRDHLRAVAYRMLSSLSEADDAVQEAWLRLSRSEISHVENLRGWLTTVVGRVCLDMLRSRKARREEDRGPEIPEVRANPSNWLDPEDEAIMAESVGLALLVVLDTLSPPERVAFVLHDVFGLSFDEIAPIVGRSGVAAKKLASRARHRVQGTSAIMQPDWIRQRKVVEAFLAASRSGNMEAIIALLDPNVVRRADRSALPAAANVTVCGAHDVAAETVTNAGLAQFARIALVNGSVGLIVAIRRKLRLAIDLKIADDKVTEIEVIGDPIRLRRISIAVLDKAHPSPLPAERL